MRRNADGLMASQYGLISRAQATDAGVSTGQIERAVDSGRWVRVERGVYRAAAAPRHDLQPLMAAVLCAGGRASHRSLLHLYGLHELPSRPELVVARASKYAGPARAYRKSLAGFRLVTRLGIPALDPLGALVTSAEVLDADELRDVVALAVSRRLVQPLRALTALGGSQGRRGAGALRRALGAYADAAAEESVLERRVVRLIRAAGLPEPVTQHRVRIAGTTYRIDHAWPAHKVALETDGYEYHSSREAFDRDRRRRNKLELAGWLVLHATRASIDTAPDELVAQLAAALALRAGA